MPAPMMTKRNRLPSVGFAGTLRAIVSLKGYTAADYLPQTILGPPGNCNRPSAFALSLLSTGDLVRTLHPCRRVQHKRRAIFRNLFTHLGANLR
jgi:hypothetical protein